MFFNQYFILLKKHYMKTSQTIEKIKIARKVKGISI